MNKESDTPEKASETPEGSHARKRQDHINKCFGSNITKTDCVHEIPEKASESQNRAYVSAAPYGNAEREAALGEIKRLETIIKELATQRDALRDIADTLAVTAARTTDELARWRAAIAAAESER